MKNLLVVSFSLCISIVFSAATSKPENFLEAVESDDISALESLAEAYGRSCNDLKFFEGITLAAERGSLASLKLLANHKCMVGENVILHEQLVELAISNGHKEVCRWLFSKSGLFFSEDFVMTLIEKAMNDSDTVKFLLTLPQTSDSIVEITMAITNNDEIRRFIKNDGQNLSYLKSKSFEKIKVNSLSNHFIDFILSPASADYPEVTIKYLVNVLLERYQNFTAKDLETLKGQYSQHGCYKVTDFFRRLIDIRKSPEYKTLGDQRIKAIRGKPYYEVVKANKPIEEKIHQFESNSMDSFVKEIRHGKN